MLQVVVDAAQRAPEQLCIDKDRAYLLPIGPDKCDAMFSELGLGWRAEFRLADALAQALLPADKDELHDCPPQLRITAGTYTETVNIDALRVHIRQLEFQVPKDKTQTRVLLAYFFDGHRL